MIKRQDFYGNSENRVHASAAFNDSENIGDIGPILELSYEHRKESAIEVLNQLANIFDDPKMNGMSPAERTRSFIQRIETL